MSRLDQYIKSERGSKLLKHAIKKHVAVLFMVWDAEALLLWSKKESRSVETSTYLGRTFHGQSQGERRNICRNSLQYGSVESSLSCTWNTYWWAVYNRVGVRSQFHKQFCY